ncbi:MAG: hemolysin family protein [Planctomycetota bacterium]
MTWAVIALLGLLSGLFSSSETALFKLDESERGRAPERVRRLLEDPRSLLVTILLCNLVVNLAFFAIAPAAFASLDPESSVHPGESAALAGGFAALVTLLVVGEIVPKALALRAPLAIARLTAAPLGVAITLLRPARRIVGGVLEFVRRLIGEDERTEKGVTPEALAEVLERSRSEGVLAAKEADLLSEIVELERLRVREAMTPRVDLVLYDLEADDARAERRRVLDEARRSRIAWLPAIRGSADRIAGSVQVRDLLMHRSRDVESLVMPVKFVPEVARLASLLTAFHIDRVSEAVVIDEWGGTAGVVTLEDVFEELVGELRVEGEEKAPEIVALGEGRFRVSGSLSVRDWNDSFGVDVVPDAFETVGGFVSAVLGRIPRAGEEFDLGAGLVGVVDEVRGRRVVALTLMSRGPDDAGGGRLAAAGAGAEEDAR